MTTLPFQPEPGESHAAFEAFLCYFDIGKNRSCGEVARRMGFSPSAPRRWSSKFKWKERMAAYHAHLLSTRVEAETEAKRDLAQQWAQRAQDFKQREWAAAEKLLKVADAILESFNNRDPDTISLAEVSRALEVASKLGRLATGLATEKQEHTGPDGGPIRLELEAALNKIYGKPLPGEIIDVPAAITDRISPIPEDQQLTASQPTTLKSQASE